MPDYLIAASVLAANFAHLGRESHAVLAVGADRIHLDVMDNHYVPNLTVGPMVCQALRQDGITAPIDVHLMTRPVDSLIPAFAAAGATSITIHPEATDHLDRSLQLIRDQGCLAGVAVNPATSLAHLKYVLSKVDIILLMTVNPGFGGQIFIPSSYEKIREAHTLIQLNQKPIRLAVDGGVNADNLKKIAQAGADTFVMGTSIFSTSNYAKTLQNLRSVLTELDHGIANR